MTRTRKRVKLAFISNISERKASYKKREKGIIKKVSELSTLCDVDACAIIYNPYTGEPTMWPPSREGVEAVLSRFNKLPEIERTRRMVNQDSFNQQRLKTAQEQLKRVQLHIKRKELEYLLLMCIMGKAKITDVGIDDVEEMKLVMDHYLRMIKINLDASKSGSSTLYWDDEFHYPDTFNNMGPSTSGAPPETDLNI